MMAQSYDFAVDVKNDAWMVVHLATGDVALLDGRVQRNLSVDEADDMAALLNRIAGTRPIRERMARP